jgi:hypothetical protein
MPIDFKALTEQIENEKGRCLIPQSSYDWVDGFRVDCITGARTPQKVYYLIEDNGNGHCIRFLNGVTGFESYYVVDLLANKNEHPSGFWAASCGCVLRLRLAAASCETIGRWDGLYVNAKQVQEKLQNLPFLKGNLALLK